MRPRFASVVLDVDSTLSYTEGIEWLATRRGDVVSRRVAEATARAMHGDVALEDIYAARLELVRPDCTDIDALGQRYIETVAPGASDALATLRAAGVRLVIVSGGLRDAILPLTRMLCVADTDVHAVPIMFTEEGKYAGFNACNPLARSGGKPAVVRALALGAPVLALGDGATDAELKTAGPPAVDAFAAFTGVAAREPVVRVADYVVQCFAQLPNIVLT
ncbi:MAG: HAD-IB family phosphatase [Gemmatimonadaceae bacterium]